VSCTFWIVNFFITQNGVLLLVEFDLTNRDNVASRQPRCFSGPWHLPFAAVLKWLTPRCTSREGVFRGLLDGVSQKDAAASTLQGKEYG